jgi:GNAT superfamily N-acetyltransferase
VFTIRVEDLHATESQLLIDELNTFLDGLYPPEDNFFDLPETDVFLVARDAQGLALGCGAVRGLEPDELGDAATEHRTGEIKRMYVRPHARRSGVARGMLIRLEEEAWRLGFGRLVLETGIRQPEAIHMYETHGYVEIPLFGQYVTSGTSVCYQKFLTGYFLY